MQLSLSPLTLQDRSRLDGRVAYSRRRQDVIWQPGHLLHILFGAKYFPMSGQRSMDGGACLPNMSMEYSCLCLLWVHKPGVGLHYQCVQERGRTSHGIHERRKTKDTEVTRIENVPRRAKKVFRRYGVSGHRRRIQTISIVSKT